MSVAQQPTDIPKGYQFTRAAAATVLTIPSRTGHRRILHDYWVKDGASGFSDLKVGNATLLRVYDNLAIAALIQGAAQRFGNMGFLGYLAAKMKDMPLFNAGQDESIVFTRDSAADLLLARWEDQDSGDITNRALPGGSQAKKHLFILNRSNLAALTASGVFTFDFEDMPAGLSMFTDGSRMSANNRFTLYGVACNNPVTGASEVTAVHIFDEQVELFTSETNTGLNTIAAQETQLGFDISPPGMFWLDEPYVFQPNRQLAFKGDFTKVAADDLAAKTQKLFLIGIREML